MLLTSHPSREMSRIFRLCTSSSLSRRSQQSEWVGTLLRALSELSSPTVTRNCLGECSTARIGRPPPAQQSALYPLLSGRVWEGFLPARMHRAPPLFSIQIAPRVRDARAQELLPHAPILFLLPSRHVIPLLLQTPIDETRIRLIGLRRTGNDMEQTG